MAFNDFIERNKGGAVFEGLNIFQNQNQPQDTNTTGIPGFDSFGDISNFFSPLTSAINDLPGQIQGFNTQVGGFGSELQSILDTIPQDFEAQRARGLGQVTQQTQDIRNQLTQGAARRGLSSGGSQAATAATNLGTGALQARQGVNQAIENRESEVARFKAAIQSGDIGQQRALINQNNLFGLGIGTQLQGDQTSSALALQLAQLSSEDLEKQLKAMADASGETIQDLVNRVLGGFFPSAGGARALFG